MKFLIFLTVSAVSVALAQKLEVKPECVNQKCDFDYHPHCACKTLQPEPVPPVEPEQPESNKTSLKASDDCVQFTNECFFKEYNCSSKAFVQLRAEECDEDYSSIPISVQCWRKCWNIYYPVCGCKTLAKPNSKTCRTFNHPCFFNMFNCTSQDYVRLHYGACPKTSRDEAFDLLSFNFNF